MSQNTNQTQTTENEKSSGGIKKKFTSRKFLLSLVGIVTGICGIIGCNNDTVAVVAFVALEILSIVAYLICEGRVDAAAVSKSSDIINEIAKVLGIYKETGKAEIPDKSTGKDIIDALPEEQSQDGTGQKTTTNGDGTFFV